MKDENPLAKSGKNSVGPVKLSEITHKRTKYILGPVKLCKSFAIWVTCEWKLYSQPMQDTGP